MSDDVKVDSAVVLADCERAAEMLAVVDGPKVAHAHLADCELANLAPRLAEHCRRLAAENERLRANIAAANKRADDWMAHADSLRCPKCTHPRGPIGKPRGLEEDGYQRVWVCPCDCHADVAALQAERDRLRSAITDAGLGILQSADKWTLHDVSERGKAEEAKTLEVATRNAELEAEVERLRKRLAEEERAHEVTIRQRDFSSEWADKLASGVGDIEVIGEHSSLNNPWETAYGLMRSHAEFEALQAERDKLAAFKAYVHTHLDSKGIPHHPPGTHGAEGCRIGDRMDYVFAEMGGLRQRVAELNAELLLWRPLTPEEAEQAVNEAEAAPLSEERIAEIVARAIDPAERVTNSEQAQMAARVKALEVALNPFALLAIDNPQADDGVPIRHFRDRANGPAVEPTMADCRRAAELLKGKDGDQ